MTGSAINKPVFALYKHYSDGSGQPVMIYIGDDKAAGFDALMAFAKREYFDSYSLRLDFAFDPVKNPDGKGRKK